MTREDKKQEIAHIMMAWRDSGGCNLEGSIDQILDLDSKSVNSTCPPLDKDKAIREVMKNFDFVKVKKAMDALGWKWALSGGVPSLYQIEADALYKLEQVCFGSSKCIWSGGFFAELDEKEQVLSLKFILTGWEAFDEP